MNSLFLILVTSACGTIVALGLTTTCGLFWLVGALGVFGAGSVLVLCLLALDLSGVHS